MQLLDPIPRADLLRALEVVARYYNDHAPCPVTLAFDGLRPVALKRPFDVRRAKDAQ